MPTREFSKPTFRENRRTDDDNGTPPKKAKAETCPSRNASVVSAG
jgi:hypothetical protein